MPGPPPMKTFLKIMLGLAVLAAGFVALIFWMTAGLPRAADQFFKHIAANDYDAALAMTTPDFRASTDRAALEAFARANGLDGYKSASWSSRSTDNNVGLLKGSVIVADGAIPISVNLVKHEGEWKIQNVHKADAGVSTDSSSAPITAVASVPTPDAGEQQQLVADTLSAFADSINADDFGILHEIGASRFKEQVSVEKLRESFSGFVEQKVDLSVLESMTPMLDASSGVGPDGTLRLLGNYETSPSRTTFDLRYEREDAQWRLININVEVR
jgi:hypothetical protein